MFGRGLSTPSVDTTFHRKTKTEARRNAITRTSTHFQCRSSCLRAKTLLSMGQLVAKTACNLSRPSAQVERWRDNGAAFLAHTAVLRCILNDSGAVRSVVSCSRECTTARAPRLSPPCCLSVQSCLTV